MSAPYGIDLGTTNSVIAHLVNGRPQAIAVAGSPIVPSVVLFQRVEGKDRVVVGREARNLALLHPAETVRSVKRRMGEEHVYEIGGRRLTPEDVSAEILRALKVGAEQATGEEVRDVVITVPAYFNDAQRRATLRAGELAGLNVLRLLNEPTAASLVYEHSSATHGPESAPGPEIVLIYDLGGGTFDVSVLEVFDGVREVRATTGNSRLGGDDFDDLLLRHFLDELRVRASCDPREDARAMARLSALAEDTKIKLSSQVEVQVREEFLTTSNGKPVHLDVTVTRRQFEDMVRPLLESTIALAHRAVDDAQLTEQKLTRICLVGGSTRIPLVRQLLERAFSVDIHEEVDPDLAVGLGAAVQAAILSGVPVERILVDVNAHTLGIRAIGDSEIDHFAPILRRNTPLPTEHTEEFYTMMDQQAEFLLEVFQGESHRVSRNHKVGEYMIDLAPAPAHSPVQVRFSYDLDGVVKVLVAQPGAQKEKTVLFRVADASKEHRAPALMDHAAEVHALDDLDGHDDQDDLEGIFDAPAQPSTPQSALERKAQAMLARLTGPRHDELERLLGAHRSAGSPEDRARAEDRLLDFLMSAEDEEA